MERSQRYWSAFAVAVISLFALAAVALFRDYGIPWDEPIQKEYGDRILRWYASGFSDHGALEWKNTFLYGGIVESVLELFALRSPLGVYETRHLINPLFGIIGLIAVQRIGSLLGGAPAGAMSALFLATTPVFFAHSFYNSKDLPFAAFFAFSLYYLLAIFRASPSVARSLYLKFGVWTGFALGVRIGGVFLIGYLAVVISVLWISRSSREKGFVRRSIAWGLLSIAIAWGIMLIAWPWAQQSPIKHPFMALAAASKFPWSGEVLFNGRYITATELPWSYLPTWFAISVPEFYFLSFSLGALALMLRPGKFSRELAPRKNRSRKNRSRKNRDPASSVRAKPGPHVRASEIKLLLFFAVFPVVAAIVLRSTLYDGLRHFLFALPPLAALAGIAASAYFRSSVSRRWKWVVAAIFTLTLGHTLHGMARLHPYESIYFNRLFGGGLKAGAQRFETDYWGLSYKEAAEWLVKNYHSTTPVRVANCADPFLTDYFLSKWAPGRFVSVWASEDPDILLATTRFECHETTVEEIEDVRYLKIIEKGGLWFPDRSGNVRPDVLAVVSRGGVPLAYVLEVRKPD